MKKLALTTACALAITGAAFAQGNVNWSSITFTAVTFQTNSTAYSPFFPGNGTPSGGAVGATGSATTSGLGYYYALLYSPYSGAQATIPSLSSLLSWQNTSLMASNSATAGRLQVMNGTGGAQVPWSPGTTDSIVLVGWSANLGTTWGVVSNLLATGEYVTTLGGQNGFLGITQTGYTTTFDTATSPGASVFGPATAQGLPITGSTLSQMYLLPTGVIVPEPTTMALAGLGGLSLLLFRRSRKS